MSDERAERFTTLYEETRARIVAYAMRRTASRDDAADVVADTYAIAWRKLDDVPDGHAGLLWLYVTARHVLSNRGRRLFRDEKLIERLAVELGDVPLTDAPQDEAGLMALFCLNVLPEDHREMLMLAGWEGLSSSEMGQVLQCSPLAARLRLHRARVQLKAALADPTVVSNVSKQEHADRHEVNRDTTVDYVPEEV